MTSRSLWLSAGLAMVAGVLVFLLWPRHELSPQEAVERDCVLMLHAAEAREVGKVLEHVSDHFRAGDGMTKMELGGLLTRELLSPGWVRIFMADLSTELVAPNHVVAHAKFVFGRSDAKSLRDLAKDSVMSAHAVDADFTREADGQWRMTGERHRLVAPEELLSLE